MVSMEKKREISEYRERLDKTLSSAELTNYQTLKTLIRNQLNEECNEDMLDQRAANLSCILEKLRSASTKEQELFGDWKVKQDYEDCRVMYREGIEKSPFHTLLVEGYMDGPIEDCLCVSWESSLFEKWWPKSTFPSFKILQTKCLQKSRINEQICLVRMKVPWPMKDREAIVQFFLFEYFKDGLVIILLNSVSTPEVESINKEATKAVRINLVGGVAIQKVTPGRSYLRSISELDIKLDLVPPSFINFMSRQLLGNGFRLFKKTIESVAKSDDYIRVLADDPLYAQIRQALYSTCESNELHSQEGRDCEEKEPNLEADELVMEPVPFQRDVSEIQEEESDAVHKEEDKVSFSSLEVDGINKTENKNSKRGFCISPEVKQALGTLETVITMVKKSKAEEEEEEEVSSSLPKKYSESTDIVASNIACVQDPKIEVHGEASLAHYNNHNISSRRSGSSSFAREGSNKIAPASPEIVVVPPYVEIPTITVSEATTLFTQTAEKNDDKPSGLNGGKSSVQQRKQKPGCFSFRSWMRRI